ncbi:hypothetical protein VQ643_06765 [Pseudomonas sp. F1_0610]|uniref:roadblock/LC7 domain-containing protein n=1 Tax=Pseudomonas sp. F1_0610 TaxID=3114284 RepID=UPI0039C4A800
MSKSDIYLLQLCSSSLEQLKLKAEGFCIGAIALADGFPLVNISCDTLVERRVTAMSAALFGLSSSIAKEFQLKNVNSIVVECEQGLVVCRQIRGPKRNYILFTLFDDRINYGTAMWHVKNTEAAISTALAQPGPAKE